MSNTLREVLEAFLGKYSNANTRKSMGRDLYQAVNWMGAEKRIDQLSRIDIARYVGSEITSPTVNGGVPYQINTQRTKLKALVTWLNWCHKNKLIDDKLSEVVELPPEPLPDARDKAYSDDEIDRLIMWAAGELPSSRRRLRDLALFLFCHDTGARVSSLTRLQRKHIHMDVMLVELYNSKRRRWFTAVFGEYTAQILAELLETVPGDPEAYLWNTKTPGAPMKAAALSQIPSRACEKLGIQKQGIHGFRRAVGVSAIESGLSVEFLADILNDSVPVAQKHYAPREIPAAKEAARLLTYVPANQRKIRKFKLE